MTPHPGQLREEQELEQEHAQGIYYKFILRPPLQEADDDGAKKSHHVSSWLVLAAPPCECLIFGHKCCPRRVANFKIEFTIWIELLTDLAGLCFRPYSLFYTERNYKGLPNASL